MNLLNELAAKPLFKPCIEGEKAKPQGHHAYYSS